MGYKTYNSWASIFRIVGIILGVLFLLGMLFFAVLGIASLISGISIPTIFGVKEVAEITAKLTL